MTAPNEAPAAAPTAEPADASTTAEPDTTAPQDGNVTTPDVDAEQDSPNSEAAKRRRQLRETQSELATVRDQLAAFQRRHAEQIIADVLTVPSDLFEVGQQNLSDFIDTDTGEIRTDELRTAAASLVEQRPQLGTSYTPPFPGDFGQGVRQAASGDTSWASVLGDQRRHQSTT